MDPQSQGGIDSSASSLQESMKQLMEVQENMWGKLEDKVAALELRYKDQEKRLESLERLELLLKTHFVHQQENSVVESAQQIASLQARTKELEKQLQTQERLFEEQTHLMNQERQAKMTLQERLKQLEQPTKQPALVTNLETETHRIDNHVWHRFFGQIDPHPPQPPATIRSILERPCPFVPGKRIQDTHMLVLIPSNVDEEPYCLDLLGALIHNPKAGGHKSQYQHFARDVQHWLGRKVVPKSYWILITKDIIPKSHNQTLNEQTQLIAKYARETHLDYQLPGALEVATMILLQHARFGEILLGGKTFTRCHESIRLRHGNVCLVGNFVPGVGPQIAYDDGSCSHPDNGVVACIHL